MPGVRRTSSCGVTNVPSRLVERAIRQSKALPSFAGTAAHEVRLTLEGTVRDPSFVRYLERLGEERLATFSTHDFLTLAAIATDASLTDALRERLPGLLETGAIESQGRGRGVRYLLSRGLHATPGKKGTYTRKRGLDHETNKALLMKHLSDTLAEGAPMAELVQVLPALSRTHIKRLLQELSAAGLVSVRGITRSARWFAQPGNLRGYKADIYNL